ncbi:hypothetical protein CS542_04180 [Pedobacter sp. IW39]|nr:hypothetical protein CS542_04180 [Pedobacter sp. IW39]
MAPQRNQDYQNDPSYYSYKDSQGFRSYPSLADTKNTNSRKLKVKLLNARIFHYLAACGFIAGKSKELQQLLCAKGTRSGTL